MESLFFNTPTQRYQSTKIYESTDEHLIKTDISNGIFFYDVSLLDTGKQIDLKGLDRMVMIVVLKSGDLVITNHQDNTTWQLDANSTFIYCSSRQDFSFSLRGEVFILFIADFFLQRYLSFQSTEPIDFLYNKIQDEIILEQISHYPLDALSLYLIDKIIDSKNNIEMQSIRCMYRIMEFITHHLSLLNQIDQDVGKDDVEIATKARDYLLKNFKNPPTIEELAHLCATNESKLKKVFKQVYKSTIYSYVQKLRLEKANLLLREEALTVGAIASTVGYKHQGHFSKLFFKTYGVYPKDLLKG